MRDFKGMKRQRGRNRGGGGGGKPQHNANRAFDSNGPEGVKVRGAAQSVFEKYQQLARDAASAGDRVLAENYLQHAEHYFRVIRAVQPNRPVTEIVGREQLGNYDIDFEAEPEEQPEAPAQAEAETSEGGEGEGGQREDRPRFRDRNENRDRDNRGDRNENRDRGDRQENRGDRQDRPEGQGGRRDRWRDRDDRGPNTSNNSGDRQENREPREPREPRAEREGGRRERFDRDRGERGERQDREQRDPLAVIEPQAAPLTVEASEPSPQLRGQDGAVSHAPAFLSRAAAPAPEAADGEVKKPRRRRAPRSFEGGEGEAPATAPEAEEA